MAVYQSRPRWQPAAAATDLNWQAHKPIMEDLYLIQNKTMREVRDIMAELHGFHSKKNQYERYFNKWCWNKKISSLVWDKIYHVLESQGAGITSAIWSDPDRCPAIIVDNNRVDKDRVCREMKRRRCVARGRPLRQVTLPPGVTIIWPPNPFSRSWLQELPFSGLERHLVTKTSHSLAIRSPVPFRQEWDITADPHLQNSITMLKAVIPSEIARSRTLMDSARGPNQLIYSSSLERDLFFAVTNNFAAITEVPKANIIGFLLNGSSKLLHTVLQSAPDLFAARALAYSVFVAAIEAGNARVVRALLQNDALGLDVNGFIRIGENDMQTPIERASTLQSKGVVKVLLEHQANVNLTRCCYDRPHKLRGGALERLVWTCCQDPLTNEFIAIEATIFEMLLHADGNLGSGLLVKFSQLKEHSSLLVHYLERHITASHTEWLKESLFHFIITYQEYEVSRHLITMLLSVCQGTPLDTQCERAEIPAHLVDVVAKKGYMDIVTQLLDSNASLNKNTLCFAVESGNYSLVKWLLQKNAHMKGVWLDGGNHRYKTALSRAIRLNEDNNRILELLLEHGALNLLGDDLQLDAALRAAIAVGNRRLAIMFLDDAPQLRPEDLTAALVEAIETGRNDMVALLFDRGVSVNPPESSSYTARTTPLHAALKKRDIFLVQRLLHETGAKPNYCDSFVSRSRGIFEQKAAALAVEWGNAPILQALVDLGVDFNICCFDEVSGGLLPALTFAVRKRAFDLVDVLLNAGADPSSGSHLLKGPSSLAAAASSADMTMAQKLLGRGACPHDPWALAEAVEFCPELCDLLIRTSKLAHGFPMAHFGSLALTRAIAINNYPMFGFLLEQGLCGTVSCQSMEKRRNWPCKTTNPFWHAIQKAGTGDFRFVERLLQDNASPDLKILFQYEECMETEESELQITAFLAAIRTRCLTLVELFLKHRANVNHPMIYGIRRTPLQEAAESGNVDVVELLIKAGADVNMPAAYGYGGTALQLAAIHGYFRIMEILLKHGAEVDAPDSKVGGRTALEAASENGRLDAVSLLLQAGAGCDGKDKAQFDKATALAKSNGFAYICDMLKDYLDCGIPRQVSCRPTYAAWIDWEVENEDI